jgi:hypothetical protein
MCWAAERLAQAGAAVHGGTSHCQPSHKKRCSSTWPMSSSTKARSMCRGSSAATRRHHEHTSPAPPRMSACQVRWKMSRSASPGSAAQSRVVSPSISLEQKVGWMAALVVLYVRWSGLVAGLWLGLSSFGLEPAIIVSWAGNACTKLSYDFHCEKSKKKIIKNPREMLKLWIMVWWRIRPNVT